MPIRPRSSEPAALDERTAAQVAELFRAFSDTSRVRLIAALAVFSLTAHFVADAVCKSPEFLNTRQCGSAGGSNVAGGEQLTTSSLHSGYMWPIMGTIGSLLTLTFAL